MNVSSEIPTTTSIATAANPDKNTRAFLDYVKGTLGSKTLIDVKSQKELTGEITEPSEYHAEHACRAGHIPSAVDIWDIFYNDLYL